MSDGLTQYVVYENPADYPGMFVVRQWKIGVGSIEPGTGWTTDSLEHARQLIPPGLYRLDRAGDDDPCIVEVWT